MAAATPSRPQLCIVPSDDVLSLAEELQGLGGNDIALANTSVINLKEKLQENAQEVAGWLTAGFNATLVPLHNDIALLTNFLQQVAARLDASLALALGWADIGVTKAVDCLGKAVPAGVGIRSSAHSVRFSHQDELRSILQVAFDHIGSESDLIFSLGVFNMTDSTLSSLSILYCGRGGGDGNGAALDSNSKNSAVHLYQLLAEVAELHARRHAGDHVLRSSRLGLFNQLAAPIIAGNVRLFIPSEYCPAPLAQRMPAVRAVCTRTQIPATELKWVAGQDFLQAVVAAKAHAQAKEKTKGKGAAAAGTRAALQTKAASTAVSPPALNESSQGSAERSLQQRMRASATLRRAAAQGAARLSQLQENNQGTATSGNERTTRENTQQELPVDAKNNDVIGNTEPLVVDIPSLKGSFTSQGIPTRASRSGPKPAATGVSKKGAIPDIPAAKEMSRPGKGARQGVQRQTPSPRTNRAATPKGDARTPARTKTAAMDVQSFNSLNNPSGAVGYRSLSPGPPRAGLSPAPGAAEALPKSGQQGYAAAYRATQSQAGHTPVPHLSRSPGAIAAPAAEMKEGAQQGNPSASPELVEREAEGHMPATAALQRRLWASTTAPLYMSDVFKTGEFSVGLGEGGENEHLRVRQAQPYEQEYDQLSDRQQQVWEEGVSGSDGELHFDLSQQAAAKATTATAMLAAQSLDPRGSEGSAQSISPVISGDNRVHNINPAEFEATRREHTGDHQPLKQDNNMDHQLRSAPQHAQHAEQRHKHLHEGYRYTHMNSQVPAQAQLSSSESPASNEARRVAGPQGGILDTTPALPSGPTAAELAKDLAQERRVNSILLQQLQDTVERAATATAVAAAVPAIESLDPGDFKGLLAALQEERRRSAHLAQQAQHAAEAHLRLEVELAAAQRDSAVARARCRALERESALPGVFAQCEGEVKKAQEIAAMLQKENADLARAVAEAEVATLVTDATRMPSDASAVISTLHKKLQAAYTQVRKLQEELETQQASKRAAESAVRGAEVSRRAAEDALKRNASLQAALITAERRLEGQCLAAAEAWGAVEELQRERDEAKQASATEQERCEQLLDLVESLQIQARVGAAAWSKAAGGRLYPATMATPDPRT